MPAYQLARSSISSTGLEFRPLAIVLAAQVGFPRSSSALLSELVKGQGETRISKRVADFEAGAERADQAESAKNDADRADWASLTAALRAVCVDKDGHPVDEFDRPLSEPEYWIPRLRRFSFEGALGPSA